MLSGRPDQYAIDPTLPTIMKGTRQRWISSLPVHNHICAAERTLAGPLTSLPRYVCHYIKPSDKLRHV